MIRTQIQLTREQAKALKELANRLVPLLEPVWIDEELHESALAALFAAVGAG